jgi:hypothetical protein
VALRAVLGEVVELPVVVVEGHAGLVAGDRLPPVGVDGPVAHHLEVLDVLVDRARRGRRTCRQDVPEIGICSKPR